MPSSDTPSAGTNTATAATAWKSKLPRRVRTRPRAYGVGRYGTDKYDSRDDTRYGWTRVAQSVAALVLGFLFAATPAEAVNAYCESADAATTVYSFCKPSVDVEGANAWGLKFNTNLDMVETALQGLATSSGTLAAEVARLHLSTTAIAAATTTIVTNELTRFTAVGTSTTSIAAATTTINSNMATQFTAVGVSTTGIAVATTTIVTNYDAKFVLVGTSTQAIAASTGTLLTTKLSSPTASGTAGQFLRIKTDGANEWATAGTGDVTQASGGTFATSAALVIPSHVITSSHPCRVIQSSTTLFGLAATQTGTNNTVGGTGSYITGSSLTLRNFTNGNYMRFSGNMLMSRNNNSGPILGAGPMIAKGTGATTIIGRSATITYPLWTTQGILNTRQPIGAPYTHPTALSAGDWTSGVHAFIDTSDTWSMYGGTAAAWWFTIEEVTCAQ